MKKLTILILFLLLSVGHTAFDNKTFKGTADPAADTFTIGFQAGRACVFNTDATVELVVKFCEVNSPTCAADATLVTCADGTGCAQLIQPANSNQCYPLEGIQFFSTDVGAGVDATYVIYFTE